MNNTIQVNGLSREWKEGTTVISLLGDLGLEPDRVVVELNGIILDKKALGEQPMQAGDILEIVHFVGGG